MNSKLQKHHIYVDVGDDYGCVEYVQHMGSDQTIIDAARVSFAGDGARWREEQDPKLLRYLIKNEHWCYSADTEVLTSEGFIPWPQVTADHALGCWDPEASTLVYEEPLRLYEADYEGRMYRVNHGGVDLLVTPNHRMFVARRRRVGGQLEWGRPSLVRADELEHNSMVRYFKQAPLRGLRAEFDAPAHDDPDAFLNLLGFFIGDGHAEKTCVNQITFNVRKTRKLRFLEETALALGWGFHVRESGTAVVAAPGISQWFREHCYEGTDKCLPSFWRGLNQGQAQAVLTGLRESDGSSKRGAWRFNTTSPHVASAFPILALHAGEAVHENEPNPLGARRFMVLSRMRQPVVNQSRRNTSWEQYAGKVYCAETRTGVLVVRRNHKIVLCGNSPLEHTSITWHVAVPLFVRSQWMRHRAASYNEVSRRYTSEDIRFFEPKFFRPQAEKNKQASVWDPERLINPRVATPWDRDYSSMLATSAVTEYIDIALNLYETLLEAGVSREQARMVLPQNMYTRFYVTMNLRNAMHFIRLREDSHAQWEIYKAAEGMREDLEALYPETIKAWNAVRS